MAITVYVEVSVTGYADGDFASLTSYTDTGPATYDHAPVVPGQLYIYRARRYDSVCDTYSDWAYAFARPPYPIKDATVLINTTEVATNRDERLFVAIEPFENVPTKVAFRVPMVSGGMQEQNSRRYSRVKRAVKTARSNARKGPIKYTGSYNIEIRPEGGATCFLASAFKYSSTGSLTSPTRYKHRFINASGINSMTVIHQIGFIYKVYVGCKTTSFQLSPDYNGTDTLVGQFDLQATGYFEFDKRITSTVETILGIDVASGDISNAYAPDDGSVFINGVKGAGCDDLKYTLANSFEEYRERDGTRAAKALIETIGDPKMDLTTYFNLQTMKNVYRDFGYSSDPTAAYTPQKTTVTTPIILQFLPPASVGGVINELTFGSANCDVECVVQTQESGAVKLQISAMPLDVEGDATATDSYIDLTNTYTSTQIVAPGAAIDPVSLPADKVDREYDYGLAAAGATTTSISAGSTNLHLSSVDSTYVGMRLRIISGALAGVEKVISAYTGATRTFTVAAFASAPATGVAFVIL